MKLFLAGSINDGKSVNWQKEMEKNIINFKFTKGNKIDLFIYNPRISDTTDLAIEKQIKWEQNHIHEADIVYFRFEEEGNSLISLLELGQCLNDRSLDVIVYCHENYIRETNVRLTCKGYTENVVFFTNDLQKSLIKLYRKLDINSYTTYSKIEVIRPNTS